MTIGNFTPQRSKLTCFIVGMITVFSLSASAGPREQAKRIHDRIAGIPPTEAVLTSMQADIQSGDAVAAAYKAMDNDAFYSVTLKNWVTPWTNEPETVFAPLNDYTATVIGMIRDDVDIRQMLFGDIIYTGQSAGLPAYSATNNDHYEQMESQALPLGTVLQQATQSSVTGIEAQATAGVLTTRAAAKAFLIDGTNRAIFRFTLINHFCGDLEPLKDIERAADRIRQDVSRSPGGDSRIFMNSCYGCHSGMDPMIQSFAYYDYVYDVDSDPDGESGRLVYNGEGQLDAETGTRVVSKYHNNKFNFPPGYVTEDDSWVNYWRKGPNQLIGWDPALPGSGNGAKSMGQELAHSEKFARCQVEKVFENVCLRPPGNSADRTQVDTMIASLKANGYQLKRTFAESAVYCMGE
ncbi:hypothetical protein [Aliikangiella coralliicola]|uniref:DUF1585 domain-containing protein n=1 Tax=Aliikangiella coralliicola TaxID=2592383 RepID=A0A545UAT8_9GAMM|nr:hypothetical protein [Aliikangiella coralliicola]TQV86582.1 hypothetical protein FLL46_16920 [Aliikangiella coralliicola]